MSSFTRTTHVSLFDRLCGPDSALPQARLSPGEGLRASLQRELSKLLNSRSHLTRAQFMASEASVLNYGLPDLVGLCTQSDTDLEQLAQIVGHGIHLFEPRLFDVRVQAQRDPTEPTRARLTVVASALEGREVRRVDFAVVLDEAESLRAREA